MEFIFNNIAMISIPYWNVCLNLNVTNLLSFVLMPGLCLLGALHQFIALLLIPTCTFVILYNHRKTQSNRRQTRFFAIWLWSAMLFTTLMYHWDVYYVQMLRMTIQRTVTALLAIAALYCAGSTIYVLKWRQPLNSSMNCNHEISNEDNNFVIDLQYLIEEHPKICIHCNRERPPKSVHCSMCRTCVEGFIYHSYWLDCCINKENSRFYYATLKYIKFFKQLDLNRRDK
uniref:Palmitoyltransferase n=1 Tax=Glossina brevipalpis TaxID=37001 RepID=A0A1A9WLK9_9MUSC